MEDEMNPLSVYMDNPQRRVNDPESEIRFDGEKYISCSLGVMVLPWFFQLVPLAVLRRWWMEYQQAVEY
jgi:hypothetical protein